ncbi:LacI family DNA-binding transcriptional regulator [Schaalia sp. ZJ405]|uniref:LacI family DNA-binding transcriptional regulator n=1 Tax=Schaalia sp. ZJ405 TaxID=2709403 RepID=UPI0013EBE11F|nr:LacI family DNA-binding transcriptional regulator [Schaalia sp. ZJ405]QPK80933.1 LacI family DNA-binding transcriptional regulator [Schaalia sp. ZJ405]
MDSRKPTLAQVAARAGVSIGSASRAMRGTGASEAVVAKVHAVAEELGYIPDFRARALRAGRTMNVAFAVPDIGNPVYVEMLKAITEVLSPAGYRVVVLPIDSDATRALDVVRSFSNGSIDAVIMSTVRVNDALVVALNESPIPVVLIGQPVEDGDFDTVATDSTAGIVLAVEHVLALGYTDLVFVNGPLETRPGAARQNGFDKAVEDAGSRVKSARTLRVDDFTLDDGSQAGRRIVRLWEGSAAVPGVRAVIAANDLLAIGVIRELIRAGMTVPTDVAVTGMDAIDLGKVMIPSVTSVSLHAVDRGKAAAQRLLDRFDNPELEPQATFLEPTLVIAESTSGEERMNEHGS